LDRDSCTFTFYVIKHLRNWNLDLWKCLWQTGLWWCKNTHSGNACYSFKKVSSSLLVQKAKN
jgi:hypothetical protein